MTSLNALDYLRKVRVEEDIDKIIYEHLSLTDEFKGVVCKKCGITQGHPYKGFQRYYCEHLTKEIDKMLKKRKEMVSNQIIDLMCQDVEIAL